MNPQPEPTMTQKLILDYVYDHEETEHGRHYVLIRDDEEL